MSAARDPIELSVIVPCYNEEGNLPELVERTLRVFSRRGIAGELVLVNDASRDGTGPQIDALAARHAEVVGVHHATNRGIPGGWRSGFERSRGRYVCTIDADLQYQPEAIAVLYREMCFSKADLVQGWRSTLERYQYDFRYYMSRGLDLLLKFAFGMPEHDVKSGFVVYKREVFEDILQDAAKYYYFQHMITVIAKGRGYSLRQVETVFEERRAGQSFIRGMPIKMILRTFADIGRGLAEFRLREPQDLSLVPSVAGLPAAPAAAVPAPGYDVAVPNRKLRPSHNAPHYLGQLRQTQWLPAEALAQLQLRRLRRLVRHAYEHVGYWREALQNAGVIPDDLHELTDLERLPILTRETLRENIYFDLLSDSSDKRKIEKLASSGRTGEPLGFFVDRLQLDMRWAAAVRCLEWTGFQPGASRVILRRDGRSSQGGARTRSLPAFASDAASLDRVAIALRTEPPALLEGDTEALAILARHLGGHEPLAVGAVVASGQTLTPALRELIEAALGGPVFDAYGAREFGTIAQECTAHEGLHVVSENVLVEVTRDGRPVPDGQPGDVLVTDLVNRCVPFLRYRLGDTAALVREPCACGRSLPRLVGLAGRPAGAAVGTAGQLVPGVFFAELFQELEFAVAAYQVTQDRAGHLTVRIVCRSRFGPETERRVRVAIAAVLGADLQVSLERVERLRPDAPAFDGRLAPAPFEPGAPPASPDAHQEAVR